MTIEETITAAVERAVSEAVRREMGALAQTQAGSVGDGLLSIAKAAKQTDLHKSTLRDLVKKGLLPRRKIGRQYRINLAELDRVLRLGPSTDDGPSAEDIAASALAKRKARST